MEVGSRRAVLEETRGIGSQSVEKGSHSPGWMPDQIGNEEKWSETLFRHPRESEGPDKRKFFFNGLFEPVGGP